MMFAKGIRILAVIVLIAGCNGGQQAVLDPPGTADQSLAETGGFNPAVPSELAELLDPPRTSSYAAEDLIKHGSQYDPTLPLNHVAADGDTLTFSPEWTPGPPASGLAYCFYSFAIMGYAEAPVVQLNWVTPPTDHSTVYVGLADWDVDRWSWHQASAPGTVPLTTLDDFIDGAGLLLMAVVVASDEVCQLRWIRLGEMPELVPQLDLNATGGVAPVLVSYSAYASDPGVGEIVMHEWDFDGDGLYDISTGTDPFITHEYETAGNFNPTVRVTTDYEEQATASQPLGVVPAWTHSWGGAEYDSLDSVVADNAAVYAFGTTQSYGEGLNAVLLVKYSTAGQLQWARAWSGPGSDYGIAMVADGTGGVYTFGRTESFGTGDKGLLIQQWSSTGSVMWSSYWGSSVDISVNDAFLLEDALYIVADMYSPISEAVLAKFDLSGSRMWAIHFGTTDNETGEALWVVHPPAGDLQIHTVGRIASGGHEGLIYCRFDDDGQLQDARHWTGVTDDLWPEDLCVLQNPARVYIAGFRGSLADTDGIFLIDLVDSGNTVNRTWNPAPGTSSRCSALAVMGTSLVLGCAFGGNPTLVSASSNGNLLGADEYVCPVGSSSCWSIGSAAGRGLALSGSATNGASGTWGATNLTAGTTAGSWAPLTVSINEVLGTASAPSGTLTIINDGVEDTGAGSRDGLVALVPVP